MLQARLIDDFKGSPTLLFWGDNADMADMLDQLRALDTDRPVARIGLGENTIVIILAAQSGRSHVKSDAGVSWECSEETLRRTADLIGPLLNSTGTSSSMPMGRRKRSSFRPTSIRRTLVDRDRFGSRDDYMLEGGSGRLPRPPHDTLR